MVTQNKEFVTEIRPYTIVGAGGKTYARLLALHLELDLKLQ